MQMLLSSLIFLAEEDQFADLKKVSEKIIPDDPWAFAIQLVATAILVVILAYFLVKPVRKYVAARQAIIQKGLTEAKEKNLQATKSITEAEKNLQLAKENSKRIIEEAKINALKEQDKINEETKREVEQMREKAKQDIERERKELLDQIKHEVVDVAIIAASKVVEREVSVEDNQKVIDAFVKDLKK